MYRLVLLLLAATAPAEARSTGARLAIAEAKAETVLRVASPDLRSGAPIPATHSAYGRNLSPALAWGGAPAGTRSFALVVEDPDAPSPRPFVHWVAYDIPASVTALPGSLPTMPRLQAPKDMRQGRNGSGSIGYFGPRPPAGDGPHHYHFQLFALDRPLELPPGATRDQLVAAMRGHVLAEGELVGTYAQPR
jgi:Raf kinase inhibitor-like YbhB/YbcL family protein